jgi:cobalt/nickel transport system permease protein
MHISDGLINFKDPASIVMVTVLSLISMVFLAWSFKKARAAYSRNIAALLALSSAFVFAAQMINFPIALGTSGHLVGGTFLAVLLGPYAAILSMTIVLLMQALFFADGGIAAFGLNVLNMAVVGGLSFFLVRLLTKKSVGGGRFLSGVFVASWFSVVIGALLAGLEIGLTSAGGITLWVPLMFFWHALIGLGEGAITVTLVSGLQRMQPTLVAGLALLKGKG